MFSKTESFKNQLNSKHPDIDNTSVENSGVSSTRVELPNLSNSNSESLASGNDKSRISLGIMSRSEESIPGIEENNKPGITMLKKVRFSQPLEFWKEFDRDQDFLDWNYNAKLQQSKDDEATRRNINESRTDKNVKGKRRQNRGKPARSITEAVQAFQLEDEKTSVRKFIAHYKRTSVNTPATRVIHRNAVLNTVISEFEKLPSNDLNGEIEGDGGICELCNSSKNGVYCVQHQEHTVKASNNSHFKNLKSFTTLEPVAQRTSKLTTLYNGRKLFDERLLPHTEPHNNCTLRDVKTDYGYLKSDYRGVPLVQRTPLIVQLFE